MHKITKGVGVGTVAVVVLASALSFAPLAASAAPASAPGAAPAATTFAGKFIVQAGDTSFLAMNANGSPNWTGTSTTTLAAAQAAAGTWTFPAFAATGPVSDAFGNCLTAAPNNLAIKNDPCTSDEPAQTFHWDGGKLVSAGGASVQVQGSTLFGVPATDGQPVLAGMSAAVTSIDVLKRSAVIGGTAQPSSTVIIDGYREVPVDADGTWSTTVDDLQLGGTTVHLENWGSEQDQFSETDLVVTLTVAELTATASAGTANNDDVTIAGSAQAGAEITITNAAGATITTTTANAVTGRYSAPVPAPNAPGATTFTVTQSLSDLEVGTTPVTFNYGSTITVTKPSDRVDHPGGPIDFAGKGEPKGSIALTEEGHDGVLGTATVLANGNWTINGIDFDETEHKLVVTQTSKGNNVTTAKLTLNPGVGDKVVEPVVTQPADGSTVATSRPTFSGTGQPLATITIGYSPTALIGSTTVGANGEWTLAPTAGLAMGTSNLVVTQVTGENIQKVDHILNRVAATLPFRVTSHLDGQDYTEGVATFRGTGTVGAKITAVNQWGTSMGTTTVSRDGDWSFSRNLGPTTDGYDITFTQTTSTSTEKVILHLVYEGALAFHITSPANNSKYAIGDTTFRGTASPNTVVKATNQWGTPMGTATADLQGDWSFIRYLGPTSAGYDITFVATKGSDSQTSKLHLDPDVTNTPVVVTSITNGDTYRPGLNVLSGTGTPGATIEAVNATNNWNVPMGSNKVDAAGTWSLPERNWGPSNDYAVKVTQTNPDKTTSQDLVNIKAPVFAPLVVTGYTLGAQNGNGVLATFTGTSTPFASIEIRSAASDTSYQKVTADVTGAWTATRTWDPDHTYKLIFDQAALDGQGDSVAFGEWTPVASGSQGR